MVKNAIPYVKKAYLINPPTGICFRDGRCQGSIELLTAQPERIPMELAYMAALLQEKGIETRLRDFPIERGTWGDVEVELRKFLPDLLIISVGTPTVDYDLFVCEIAKKINPNIITLAKGAHFDIFDKESMEKFPHLDIVIRHEVEAVMSELLKEENLEYIAGITFKTTDNKIIRNSNHKIFTDLDSLPFPARNLLKNQLYTRPDTCEPLTVVMTSRGCPFRCTFCLAGELSDYTLIMRDPIRVADEIEECIKKYKIENFFFYADTFTYKKEWVITLCEEIIKRGLRIKWGANSRADTLDEDSIKVMKRSGCEVLGFGLESGRQETLNKSKKGIKLQNSENAIRLCKKHGIKSYMVFMIGFPWETREHVIDTIEFAIKLDGDFVDFTVVYPYPGTELYQMAKEMKLFDETKLCGHDISRAMQKTLYLSTEELAELRRYAIRRFYLRPSYIVRKLIQIRSPLEFKGYFSKGYHILKNIVLKK
ncbi:MAG TPA: B12-binding domain-containing radical SAM protein [Candidatus Wunengus sp. YC65]|uniref:B12-binding domain-containing radical SAM protein n=1 Tax=Candidatus Wunengus sp. YC65 TaxID=3367701 RepID=UPI00402748DB